MMIQSYICRENCYKEYVNAFNDYIFNILYGSNVLIGSEIENKWKNTSADD